MDLLFLLALIGFLFILVVIFKGANKYENMAPLCWGTYDVDTVNSGKCHHGNPDMFMKDATSNCGVGSCHLGSNVSNAQYCFIDCAQEVMDSDREKCMVQCMDMMKNCS